MKKIRLAQRPEMLVFLAIILFVAALSFVSVQQSSVQRSSLPNLGPAPELTGTQQWINSEPLTIEGLKGKVVVVDFWTYTCINCIRTLPYLNAWHEKYSDDGLVIIGVHTPEFEFEKSYDNVLAAVKKYEIKHPVVQDNNFATWRAYGNRYWPRKYVIDREGNVRYDHIGEGAYEETERVIQELLAGERDAQAATVTAGQIPDFSQIGTPELYLGYDFARAPLGNAEGFSPGGVVDYKYAEPALNNVIYLSGKWKNENDRIVSVNNSKLHLIYTAKDVNVVAGGRASIEVLLDGSALEAASFGYDVSESNGKATAKIDRQRLYSIISMASYGTHLLQINAEPGFELYTFTFG
jgi:thiol-disulfide isomerase/thioredoxin